MKGKPLIERIERLVFGATAEERVNLMIKLAARRAASVVEARMVAALERLADEPTPETGTKENNRENSGDGGR